MIHGFRSQGVGIRPSWVSSNLHVWYFILRVEKPKGSKRRRLYRFIEKEKLRLAEQNIDQELIKATCRYLATYNVVSGNKMIEIMNNPPKQMALQFGGGRLF